MTYTMDSIHEGLQANGYFSNSRIDTALYIALSQNKPLLVEGSPGVGKTAIAQALSSAFGFAFVRMQMYEGLTDDKILYDYNYQKQLLTLEMIRPVLEQELKGAGIKEAIKKADSEISDFYGSSYLIERPILKSIKNRRRTVLLIDEIDKAPEEIEYMLFEFLENYSISIPEYGTVSCKKDREPVVLITSNGYRDLSLPLKRRCAYLYIPDKTEEEYVRILAAKAGADQKLAEGIARCLVSASKQELRQIPSVAEGVEWASFLSAHPARSKEFVLSSLSLIVKDYRDESTLQTIVSREPSLWEG